MNTRKPWWLFAALWCFTPVDCLAQAIDGEFSVQRFIPAPGPRNFLATRGARTDGDMAFSAGVTVGYALKPFVVLSCPLNRDCDSGDAQAINVNVVENLLSADVLGSLTPIPRLQIGLRAPVSFVEGDGLTESGAADLSGGGIRAIGPGDVELEAKYRLLGEISDPIVVGVGVHATAPLGHNLLEGRYVGDETPTGGLRGILDGRAGPVAWGTNVAYVFRNSARVGESEIGPELRYSAALGYLLSPAVQIIGDIFGSTRFSTDTGENALEGLAGGIVTLPNTGLSFTGGGGAGIIEGIGSPKFRALFAVSYVNEYRDTDEDGLADLDDGCPTEAEDKDGFQDGDGCPEPDNDGDSFSDQADKCPNEMEDLDDFEDHDGCPDPDNDGDGINDTADLCPSQPETKNQFEDEDGCPDVADADRDGIEDDRDDCPNQKEDTDGFEDTDGCPEPDNDGDGINDDVDECIDEPETVNGVDDGDGCPD